MQYGDITGRRYGRVVAVGISREKSGRNFKWRFRCDCGTEFAARKTEVLNGRRKHCGCTGTKKFLSRDLHGFRSGYLTAVRRSETQPGWGGHWECRCICGNTIHVIARKLITGYRRSCGCLRRPPTDELGFRRVLRRYKTNARRRGLAWQLTAVEARELLTGICVYCGVAPALVATGRNREQHDTAFVYNGIDRKRNSEGYFLANCVPCCEKCNRRKMAADVEEFLQWACRVAAHCRNSAAR